VVTEVWKALQGEEALAKEDHGAVAYKVSILKTEPLLPEHSPNFKLQMRVFRGNCEVSNANKTDENRSARTGQGKQTAAFSLSSGAVIRGGVRCLFRGTGLAGFRINNWIVAQCGFSGCMIRAMASPGQESESLNSQFLVDSMPAMIHTARPDGYLDYFNKRWLEYLGVIAVRCEPLNLTRFGAIGRNAQCA